MEGEIANMTDANIDPRYPSLSFIKIGRKIIIDPTKAIGNRNENSESPNIKKDNETS